jgi:tetratricopeptide (TPR) repeat protein
MKKITQIALALSLCLIPLSNTIPVYGQYEYNTDADYSKYYDQGIEYYNNSQYTKAIEQFTQALKLAPTNAPIRNNLAVSYISRGTYFHNNVKNYEEAANNYRAAIYYLEYDAPEDAATSPNAPDNLRIAHQNLDAAEQNLGNDIGSPSYHFKKAQELRSKGNFRESIVEYHIGLKKSPHNADAFEAIGDMYRVLQNEEHAAKAYQKALKANNTNAELYVKAGLAYEKNKKLDKAINAYNQASNIDPKNMDALNALEKIWQEQIKINPRNAAAHANLGTVLQKKGDFDRALAQYNTAELIDPNNITVRLNLGTLYQAKGDLNTAIKAYDTILTVDPKNTLAYYYKATALKQMKNYDAAAAEIKKILQYDPNNAMARKELVSITKERGGTSSDLIEMLKDIANKEPHNPQAQYEVAFEAHSNGDLNTAITYYKRAIQINPQMADAYTNLGAALIAEKEFEEATRILKKAEELDPANKEIQKLLTEAQKVQMSSKYETALQLHQQGQIKDAIKIYEEALLASPDNPEILINLGAAYQTDKRYDQALQKYEEALTLDPNSAVIYYYIGTTLHAQGNMPAAIKSYEKAIELDSSNQEYIDALENAKASGADDLLTQALDEYNNKNYDRAKDLINEALKADRNNAQAYYYMGIIMEAKNNTNSAINSYEKATQLDPQMDTAFYALGVALDKVNDKAGAKNAFKRFLELSGNSEDAFVKYARERIKQL